MTGKATFEWYFAFNVELSISLIIRRYCRSSKLCIIIPGQLGVVVMVKDFQAFSPGLNPTPTNKELTWQLY